MKYAFFFILLLAPLLAFSQNWEVEEEVSKIRLGGAYEEFDVPNKHYFSFGKEAVALKEEDEEFHIQTFDLEKLDLKKHRELELDNKKKIHEASVQIEGELYYLYAWWDDKNEEERLFARRVNREECKLDSSRKIFGYPEHEIHGRRVESGFLGVKTVDKFDFYTSQNSQKLLVQFRLKTGYGGKDTNKVGFLVFDDSMELDWKRVFKMPFPIWTMKGMMGIKDLCVTPKGEVYALVKHQDSRPAPFHFHIFKFTKEGANFDFAKFEPENFFVKSSNMTLKVGSGGNLTFGGLYTAIGRFPGDKSEFPERYKGVFACSVKPSGETEGIHRYKFSKDLILRYEDEDRKEEIEEKGMEDPKSGIKNLELLDSYLYDNGDLLLVAEQTEIPASLGRVHGYGDLIVTRISPKGQKKWMHKLPKCQEGEMSGHTDVFFKENEVQLLFFGHQENLRVKPTEKPAIRDGRDEGVLAAYRVGHEKGDITKTHILSLEDIKGKEFDDYSYDSFVSDGQKRFIFEALNDDGDDQLIEVKF